MNRYKSLILIGLFAVGFTACKTDDLEKDIDALKERVESYEMQVQKLNDEMNIIRVLLDGNKTITDYSIEGDKYTLTLSNGETIVLTQGNDGGNYPTIEIGANGNWFIDGNDTGERAEAENGENTQVTPKFEIKNDTWWVSYDGGENYVDLGKPATGTPEGTSPINDFEVSDDGSEFTFTINGKSYVIPVVKGLICEILNEQESYVVERGKSIDIKVKVAKGDLVRAVVPAEWKPTVSNYTDLTNEQELTITVTAPNISSKCVLSVEVTSGVNTASDEVTLRTATTSYYDDYMAGLDIQIGNVTINKFTHPDANFVESSTTLSSGNVYFLKEGLSLTISKIRVSDYLYIIGDKPDSKPILVMGNGVFFALNSDNNSASGLYVKNVIIDGTSNGNYLSNIEGGDDKNVVYDNFIMEDVIFKMAQDKQISYFNHKNSIVKNIYFNSCHFILADGSLDAKVVNIGSTASTAAWNDASLTIQNSVFQSSAENKAVGFKLFVSTNKKGQVFIERNTFANVYPNSAQAYIQNTPDEYSYFRKNVIYGNAAPYDGAANIVSLSANVAAENLNGQNFVDNIVFENAGISWKCFRTNPPTGITNNITVNSGSPFETSDFSSGNFVIKEDYKDYGASQN